MFLAVSWFGWLILSLLSYSVILLHLSIVKALPSEFILPLHKLFQSVFISMTSLYILEFIVRS